MHIMLHNNMHIYLLSCHIMHDVNTDNIIRILHFMIKLTSMGSMHVLLMTKKVLNFMAALPHS